MLAMTVCALLVYGSASCPSADEISAALASPGAKVEAAPPGPSQRVEVVDAGDALVLHLQDDAGTALATRRLVRGDASCQELAQAAAVIITAWQLHADEWTPELPGLAPVETAPVLRRARPGGPSRVHYELSAAFLSSITSTGAFAAGGQASAALTRRGARWFGRLSLFGTDTREQPLGFGAMSWSRVALAAGTTYRFGTTWQLDLQADAVVALLVLRGGSGTDSSAFNVDPGLRAGLRGMRRWGHLAAFLEAGVVGWLRSQQVKASGSADSVELPRVEVLLAAGVAYGN
jgi:hypothetical protein